MKLPLIILCSLLLLGSVYAVYKGKFSKGIKTYNWSLELTKPLDYNINFKNITYLKNGKEIYRYTSLNTLSGWEGTKHGSVLHTKNKEYLPDTVKLTWEEVETGIIVTLDFKFPAQLILDFWNKNKSLLHEKWGNDYPETQISLRLGLAPEGLAVLWFSDMDINTSGFAVVVGSYSAISTDSVSSLQNKRSAINLNKLRCEAGHFYPPKDKNVVAIGITYYNGESNIISLKQENNSLLEVLNSNRGWGIAKTIYMHWFDENGKGYKSVYEVDAEKITGLNNLDSLNKTHLIYLLDRSESNDVEWKYLKNKCAIELKEKERIANK